MGESEMKRSTKILFLAAGLCAARSASAYTSWYQMISGNSCHSTAGGGTLPTRWGLENYSTNLIASVECPVQVPYGTYIYQYIGISGYNRNATYPLTCSLHVSSDDGMTYSVAKATVTAASGYPAVYASAYNYPTGNSREAWVTCDIPPVVSGNTSYLNSVFLELHYN
jgi:hypothetical protein